MASKPELAQDARFTAANARKVDYGFVLNIELASHVLSDLTDKLNHRTGRSLF